MQRMPPYRTVQGSDLEYTYDERDANGRIVESLLQFSEPRRFKFSCNAILPLTSGKNLDFRSAFGIRLLVYQYK